MHCKQIALSLLFVFSFAELSNAEESSKTIFEKRILPIFKSSNPSSCTECHLANLDLKNYILPTSEKTFLSLRDQGLVDIEAPEKSRILKFITMKDPNSKKTNMILEKVKNEEFKAFSDWIKFCCKDETLIKMPKLDKQEIAKPEKPVEVVRHARKDRLLESFEQNIWAIRFRCMNCHTEGHPDSMKLQKEHGDRVNWFKKTPVETMDYILGKTKLIDLENPEKSLLLLKPLNEVKHGGGKKFLVGDLGYQSFRNWIEDYARIKDGTYKTAADLPKKMHNQSQFGTELWFKITNTPEAWGDKLLRTTIYMWDEKVKDWEENPIAISDRLVWGKGKTWQHTVTVMAPKGSAREATWKKTGPSLVPGKYKVVVQVDKDGVWAKTWDAKLDEKTTIAGTGEFKASWKPGYNQMTSIDAANISRK